MNKATNSMPLKIPIYQFVFHRQNQKNNTGNSRSGTGIVVFLIIGEFCITLIYYKDTQLSTI